MYKPNKTGRVEITNIVRPSKKIFIGGALFPIKYVTEKPTIKGKVITDNRLATAVQDIDSAVSPFANLVRIFEVTDERKISIYFIGSKNISISTF